MRASIRCTPESVESNKPKLRTNPMFEQIQKFLALGGFRIIRP